MFELKDAVKKLVAVIAPNVFLVNEVIAMWSLSAKDQNALTALMQYVKDEVDVPDATDATPKKKDKSGYQGSKGGGKGRQSGYQGSGNYVKNNQSSGNSYSSKQGQRQNKRWEPSRPKYDQSRTNTNQTATVAQVNHIRESAVAEAREQWEREQYDKDREERLESLQAQVDNYGDCPTDGSILW